MLVGHHGGFCGNRTDQNRQPPQAEHLGPIHPAVGKDKWGLDKLSEGSWFKEEVKEKDFPAEEFKWVVEIGDSLLILVD